MVAVMEAAPDDDGCIPDGKPNISTEELGGVPPMTGRPKLPRDEGEKESEVCKGNEVTIEGAFAPPSCMDCMLEPVINTYIMLMTCDYIIC
jgi:hypothetical protein